MRKRSKHIYRQKRRRRSLSASNAGPILALLSTVFGVLGVLALAVFVGLPWLLPKIGVDTRLPWQPTPTPAPTIRPTPTPHPITTADLLSIQTEIVLTGEDERYVWFADPCAWGNILVFSAGRTDAQGNVVMDALFEWNMDTGEHTKLSLPLTNQSYVYPVINEKWLVYLDGKTEGGGVLRVVERATGKCRAIKPVYVDQPKCSLDGDILTWSERTGSSVDKIFACDLITLESATVQIFSNSSYGISRPDIANGHIIYADETTSQQQPGQEEISAIYDVALNSGKSSFFEPETYVHDPMTNGKQWVWRNGLHGMGDDLYMTAYGAAAVCVAEDIVEYGLSDTFAAYSKGEAIYVYFFDDKTTHCITPDSGELTQLLDVTADGTVVWMDVTKRQGRDIMKYAKIR